MRKEILNKKVREVMTKSPVTVTPDMTVASSRGCSRPTTSISFPLLMPAAAFSADS